MTALDRQGWILVGFAVLFFTALVVSACGWILVWKGRRRAAPQGTEPEDDEPEAPADETAPLPPGTPLR
jgi:hypothetical protein